MDWNLLLAIVFGIATIVSIIIAVRLARKQKPSYACRTTHLIGRGSNAPLELKVTFNDAEVEDVYKTQFLFFNAGNDTLNYSDIADKLSVWFYDARVLKASIVKASRDVIQFSAVGYHAETEPDKSLYYVELEFDWLGHNDGAIVEVLHTKCDKIETKVDFKNTRLRENKWTNTDLGWLRQLTLLFSTMLLGTVTAWLLRIIFGDKIGRGLNFTTSDIITMTVIVLLTGIIPCYYWFRYLSVPKWARKVS